MSVEDGIQLSRRQCWGLKVRLQRANADALPKSSLGLEERLYSDEADRVVDSVERPRYAGF